MPNALYELAVQLIVFPLWTEWVNKDTCQCSPLGFLESHPLTGDALSIHNAKRPWCQWWLFSTGKFIDWEKLSRLGKCMFVCIGWARRQWLLGLQLIPSLSCSSLSSPLCFPDAKMWETSLWLILPPWSSCLEMGQPWAQNFESASQKNLSSF